METFGRGGLSFDVTDAGPPTGEVVVLLHGFPENRSSWDRVTPALTEAGFRVLAPNQRGYSPGARPLGRRDYVLPELALDIVAMLDAAGVDKAHVVGHDWGAAVAWQLGIAHPSRLATVASLSTPHPRAMLRAMVTGTQALRSWYMFVNQLPAVPEALMSASSGKRLRAALRSSGLPADAVDRYVDPLLAGDGLRCALNWYRAMPLARPTGSQRVAVPTLYVYPTGDRFLGRKAADLTGNYIDAPYRYEVLDGLSHWLPEEAPDTVADLVLEHVRKHPTR